MESVSEQFGATGIRVDRVVTDPVSLLLLAPGSPRDGVYLSTLNDILLLRVTGGGVSAARQFPRAMADRPEELLVALREIAAPVGSPALPFPDLEIPRRCGRLFRPPGPVARRSLPRTLARTGGAGPLRPDVGGGFDSYIGGGPRRNRSGIASYKRHRIAAGVAPSSPWGVRVRRWSEGKEAARARPS